MCNLFETARIPATMALNSGGGTLRITRPGGQHGEFGQVGDGGGEGLDKFA